MTEILLALMSYSTSTISWTARPTGGIPLTLVTGGAVGGGGGGGGLLGKKDV